MKFVYTIGESLIVTVFFGLTPVISRPNALAVFSFDAIGSYGNTEPIYYIIRQIYSFVNIFLPISPPINSL
jgi:hypothetical protein